MAKKAGAKSKEIQAANAAMVEVDDLVPQTIKIGEQTMIAVPKHFQKCAGSKGYHGNGKVIVEGRMCQVNVIISIIGTKPKV